MGVGAVAVPVCGAVLWAGVVDGGGGGSYVVGCGGGRRLRRGVCADELVELISNGGASKVSEGVIIFLAGGTVDEEETVANIVNGDVGAIANVHVKGVGKVTAPRGRDFLLERAL